MKKRSHAKIRSARNSIVLAIQKPLKSGEALESHRDTSESPDQRKGEGDAQEACTETLRNLRHQEPFLTIPQVGDIMPPSMIPPNPRPVIQNESPQLNVEVRQMRLGDAPTPSRLMPKMEPAQKRQELLMPGPASTTRYALQDPAPTATLVSNLVTQGGDYDGGTLPVRGRSTRGIPQTFAEMGFISKPVEEEGCFVM